MTDSTPPQSQFLSDADLGIAAPAKTPPQATVTQKTTQPNSEFLSDADLGILSARPDLRPKYDVPKSALSATERLPIGMVNWPADLSNFISSAIEKGVATTAEGAINLYNSAVGDTNTPEGNARLQAARKGIQVAHETNVKTQPYSTEQISEAIDPYARQVLPVGPAYESKTPEGKFTQSAIDIIGPGLAGKEKAATKLLRGAGSLLGYEAAEQGAEFAGIQDPTAKTALGILGTLVGGVGGEIGRGAKKTVGNIIDPTEAANQRIAEKIKQAREEGRAPTDAELQEAINAGAPLQGYDIAGERAGELVNPAAVGPARDAALKINKFITERGDQAFGRVDQGLDNILGRKIDAGDTRAKMNQEQRADNTVNYEKAKNDPLAANMESPTITKLKEDKFLNSAISDAIKTEGGYSSSLKFWDQVKRNLDDQVNEAYRYGRTNLANDLKDRRNELREDLKAQNPAYAEALDGASSFFNAKNAVEAGYKYANNLNTFKRADAQANMAKYSPDQFALFQEGFVSALKDKAQGGSGKLLDNISKADTTGKLTDVFPSNKGTQARQIQTMVDLENMTRNADLIPFAAELSGGKKTITDLAKSIGESGATGTGVGLLTNPSLGGAAGIATLIASAATRLTLSAAEKRVATQVAETLASRDPAKMLELSKQAETTPAVRTMIQKMEPMLEHMALTSIGVNAAQSNPREQRASGGSVIDKKADALVNETLRNRKLYSDHTEHMLSMPDDAIVQALNIAKQVAA
jgi:hypothetical protein